MWIEEFINNNTFIEFLVFSERYRRDWYGACVTGNKVSIGESFILPKLRIWRNQFFRNTIAVNFILADEIL